jgi:hypothetical protein
MKKPDINHPEYRQLLAKARDAKRGGEPAWSVQSTGEKLAVAMVLNQPEWISAMGYSLGEALDRVGAEWLAFIPEVERQLHVDAVSEREGNDQ